MSDEISEGIQELARKGYIEILGWDKEHGTLFRRTRKYWEHVREKYGGELPQHCYPAYQADLDAWEEN